MWAQQVRACDECVRDSEAENFRETTESQPGHASVVCSLGTRFQPSPIGFKMQHQRISCSGLRTVNHEPDSGDVCHLLPKTDGLEREEDVVELLPHDHDNPVTFVAHVPCDLGSMERILAFHCVVKLERKS